MGDPPSLLEVHDAISMMQNNKAASLDGIPAEVLKARGANLLQHMHALIINLWDKEAIPTDLRDALLAILFKRGDKTDCGKYRGSLTPVHNWEDYCPHSLQEIPPTS